MIINDPVYGKTKINDPVLIELIKSKPVQRLKKIGQAGASKYALKNRDNTRFDHSLGVLILLKKLNAPMEEQIAGLLHDIPHTAFSHVADYVFKSEAHNFHEKFHEEIINNSKIPKILKKYGFKVERIMDEHNFSLLERKIPDLCADRIDYTLRDLLKNDKCNEKVKYFLKNFIVVDNEIILRNMQSAKKFGEFYLRADKIMYSNPLEVAMYEILADAIKIALQTGVIKKSDLFKDDDFVYGKLKNSKNKEILAKLAMLSSRLKIKLDNKNYDYSTKSKLRYVDPEFRDLDGSYKRASEVYSKFKLKLEKHNQKIAEGFKIKIVSF